MIEECKHDMLNGDVFVLHGRGKPFRFVQDFVGDRGDVDLIGLSAASAHRGDPGNCAVEEGKEIVGIHTHLFKKLGNKTAFLIGERIQKMLRHDLHVLVFDRHALGGVDRFECLFCKFLCVHNVHLLEKVGLFR